jgi:hypothetical protein
MFDPKSVDKEIYADRLHTVKIHNKAYFNARIGALANVFKPQCADRVERALLKAKLAAGINKDVRGAVLRHISGVLGHYVGVTPKEEKS